MFLGSAAGQQETGQGRRPSNKPVRAEGPATSQPRAKRARRAAPWVATAQNPPRPNGAKQGQTTEANRDEQPILALVCGEETRIRDVGLKRIVVGIQVEPTICDAPLGLLISSGEHTQGDARLARSALGWLVAGPFGPGESNSSNNLKPEPTRLR